MSLDNSRIRLLRDRLAALNPTRFTPHQRWLSACHGTHQRLRHSMALPALEASMERAFFEERYRNSLCALKSSLLIGIGGFAGFILFDMQRRQLEHVDLLAHGLTMIGLVLMLTVVSLRPLHGQSIRRIAKSAVTLALFNMMVTFWLSKSPAFYVETWTSLLPLYFFSYGQLFLSLSEACVLGGLTLALVPASGYALGTGTIELIPSLFVLLMANVFGFCTRWQLESYSRRSFQQRCHAQQLAENKSLFLRQISHNLRQPLQALSCYTSVLETWQPLEQPANHITPVIHRLGLAVDELNRTFDQVFHIANLESGQQLPKPCPVDINALLGSLQQQFAPQAAMRGIKLIIRPRLKPPFYLYSDACILRQVLANLIDNAIKYTPNGWILLRTSLIAANRLNLRIVDTGIGIPQPQQQDIFKEFFRGQRRSVDQPLTGAGIGLAYVEKAIPRLPQHRLQLYSIPGRGTDFKLQLPPALQMPEPLTGCATLSHLNNRLIWILDNDRQVAASLAQALQVRGCRVEIANNASELDHLAADSLHEPDLLISDYLLDNHLNVFDCLQPLKNQFGDIPCLILSSHVLPGEVKQQLPAHIGLLRKPATLPTLLQKAMQLINQTPAMASDC